MKLNFSAAERRFILDYQNQEPAVLMLQSKRHPDLPVPELVAQIQARRKIKHKLPTWHQHPEIVYPPLISTEQSSSEITAAYKAGLVNGNTLIDLTGGFGVDSFYFAQKIKEVIYVEHNPDLARLAAHNAQLLGARNITFATADAANFLQAFAGTADWIYLDPARRGNANQKLHFLSDCEPNVLELLPLLLEKGNQVILKTSPMLDIEQARQQLRQVARVIIIAVENECKEVLYLLSATPAEEPVYEAINLHPHKPATAFRFRKSSEEEITVPYSEPQAFIYEPNTAILKAGGFKSVAQQYKVNKLHRNSHLYTSTKMVADFPGRIFTCQAVCRYQKKEILPHLPDKKANITTRNFPDPVAAIRQKLGLAEGGSQYLFATTDIHQKPVILICAKAI